jgi:hypothetical protein
MLAALYQIECLGEPHPALTDSPNAVRGKGQRLREEPLVETVARELRAYLAARALPEDLQGIDRELPFIERLREDPFEAPRSGAWKGMAQLKTAALGLDGFGRHPK